MFKYFKVPLDSQTSLEYTSFDETNLQEDERLNRSSPPQRSQGGAEIRSIRSIQRANTPKAMWNRMDSMDASLSAIFTIFFRCSHLSLLIFVISWLSAIAHFLLCRLSFDVPLLCLMRLKTSFLCLDSLLYSFLVDEHLYGRMLILIIVWLKDCD